MRRRQISAETASWRRPNDTVSKLLDKYTLGLESEGQRRTRVPLT